MTDAPRKPPEFFLGKTRHDPRLQQFAAVMAARIKRNKTHRRPNDPPAAAPAPVEPRRGGGGLSGGAAAALTFETD